MKYKLTNNKKEWFGTTLFQIKAEISFGNVLKGELGGYIEKEENLSQDGGLGSGFGVVSATVRPSSTRGIVTGKQIGRASCRERVCQYV